MSQRGRGNPRRIAAFSGLGLALILLPGCRQDMHDQAKFEALEESTIFANRASSRTPVEGTVARGQLRADVELYTGQTAEGVMLTELPMPVDRELLELGQRKYEAFCAPCHDRAGAGNGMIVRRGYKRPTSFHDVRLREAAVGYYYTVITNGFGQMSSYASQVTPRERWAITAYIRALQLSQNAPREVLSQADIERLGAGTKEGE